MKRLVLVVLVLAVMILVPGAAYADEAYDIINHDVYITVSENNVLDVVERLTLNFTQERHGFYYYLQYKGTGYYYLDDEWVAVNYNQHVYDFNVTGYDYELSKESDSDGSYLVAQIGDADKLIIGEQEYIISYKCNAGDNGYDDFDDFYRNIINCAYGDTIENASFTIELPKDFDESLVNVTLGEYGSVDSSDVYWEIDGNTLYGYALRPLEGGERITVRMEFPDDYFVGETNSQDTWNIAIYVISGLLVVLAFILWLAFGKDNRIFPTVEFYAPDEMTPAEAGYIIDGCVDNKDVISLILYWADKGYLKINELAKNKFELVKLQSLPDHARSFERIMFDKLFANGDAVSVSSLKQSFYTTVESAKTSVTNYFEGAEKRRVFTKSSKTARRAMGVITMIPIALTMFIYCYLETYDLFWSVILAVLVGWVISLPVFMLAGVFEKWRSTQPGKRTAKLVLSVIVLVAVFAIYIFVVPAMFDADYSGVLLTFTTSIATLIMVILTVIMSKRTSQGDKWFAKLLGFKNFIEKAEKDRIIRLVEENPSYFYNVLPYAYVMGVTNKWAKNFEDIGIQPPGWYSGYYGLSTFNAVMFASYMTRNMSSFQSVMTSRPPSKGSGFSGGGGFGGGGFGGGGFSGGGFGGGGAGGSW